MKARVIVQWAKSLNSAGEPNHPGLAKFHVVLGGFHTYMAFLGAIGYAMNDSGLADALGTCHGENVTESMMGGGGMRIRAPCGGTSLSALPCVS